MVKVISLLVVYSTCKMSGRKTSLHCGTDKIPLTIQTGNGNSFKGKLISERLSFAATAEKAADIGLMPVLP
ncbi:MAG: hypothetical protein HND38_11565 [Planctomycetes bacterium]|nr:hypothetical protein [Planctomycetota bacterium]